MLNISIPQPCHEDWNVMTPAEQGRHCAVCCKTVIDFSVMSDETVQQYLLQHNHKQLCGRFNTSQIKAVTIELPVVVFASQSPWWKKFLAACLVAFGTLLFSCHASVQENISPVPFSTQQSSPEVKLINIGKPVSIPDSSTTIEIKETYIVGALGFPYIKDSIPPEITLSNPDSSLIHKSDDQKERIDSVLIVCKRDSVSTDVNKDTASCNIREFY